MAGLTPASVSLSRHRAAPPDTRRAASRPEARRQTPDTRRQLFRFRARPPDQREYATAYAA